MSNPVRRWVGVIIDRSTSDDISVLKLVFWTAVPFAAAHVTATYAGWDWPVLARPFDLVWVYWLLIVTRQRDAARAGLAEACGRPAG